MHATIPVRAVAVALAAMLLLAGCATTPGRDIDDPTSSLVFGFLDMDEAPTSVDWVSLRQAGAPEDQGYWGMDVDDGLVLNQYLPNGSYQLAQFGGSGFLAGEVRYSFPSYGKNETAIRIAKPGVYFIGSYKYKKVKTGFFEAGKFDVERMGSPGERELLERIQKQRWVKGTQWEARIAARLAELGGARAPAKPAAKPAAKPVTKGKP